MQGAADRYIVGRERNIVRVDFGRRPDPPTPHFPGAAALRRAAPIIVEAIAPHALEREVA